MRVNGSRHRAKAVALLIVACGFGSSASAGNFYLGPSAYVALPDSDLHAKTDIGGQLKIGYRFVPQWSAELLSEIARYEINDGSGTLSERGFGAQGVYHLLLDGVPVVPTFALGGGYVRSSYRGDSSSAPLIQAGLGLKYSLPSPAWILNADVSLRHLVGNSAVPFYANHDQNDIVFTAGVLYEFGRHDTVEAASTDAYSDRSSKPATYPASGSGMTGQVAPTGACVAGSPNCPVPLDQDGDGVPDSLDKCPDTPPNAVVDADGCIKYLRNDRSH